jgi:hypothetical protein
MADLYFPAISTFEAMPEELPAVGCFGHEIVGRDDDFQLRVAPSGVSVKGRYWRDGHLLKALVHVQAAGTAPKTVSAQIDLRPIAAALKKWHLRQHARGVRVGGWPGSFINAVKKIGKSKLIAQVAHGVKSVVQSKITGAAIGAAAVIFPPVGVPAAAAYATANAAMATIDKAVELKNQAKAILSSGSAAQKAALDAKAPLIQQALARAADVKKTLREIAQRASRGDIAARKTARIFSHVMEHRRRVKAHVHKRHGKMATPGLLVTEYGKIVPGQWLLTAAAQSGVPLLHAAAQQVMPKALPPAPHHTAAHAAHHHAARRHR